MKSLYTVNHHNAAHFHNRMISEGSSDIDYWSNDAENLV